MTGHQRDATVEVTVEAVRDIPVRYSSI
jgi:hypothetical protein